MMSKKRFKVVEFEFEENEIEDIKTGDQYDIFEIIDLINHLSEENEKLKKELDSFKPVVFQDIRKGTIILYSKSDIDERKTI